MQQVLRHMKWMPVLMALTILGIAGFQYYWLKKAYEREERTLEMRSNFTFRETVHSLQASKLKLDKVLVDSGASKVIIRSATDRKPVRVRIGPNAKITGIVDVLNERLKSGDSDKRTFVFSERLTPGGDTTEEGRRNTYRRRDKLMQFLYDAESPADSVRVSEIDSLFRKRLEQANVSVPFTVTRTESQKEENEAFNKVTIGFKNPITYAVELHNTFPLLMKRILGPIVMSVFLLLFTILSFTLLYRNLLKQRKLSDIKNEFISNITHELKTPIATVSVAIEALRSFNASMDPARTKEYLDISANELQRLSMLVDKVLKLSMFEKREIELKYEPLDMAALVGEVTSSMRLQFEKASAQVDVQTEGDTHFEGDRLNLVSVIFNLVDNALKYGSEHPKIAISVTGAASQIVLCVADNGIGIPVEYKDRIFEKFFRVPTGNVHNAKGYGLGLSYAAHIVKKHGGTIKVEPNSAGGSKFMVSLPKTAV